jgi:hypothetical protein
MAILLIVGGITSACYGILNIAGRTKNDVTKDSEMDKRLLSEKTRRFIGRYYAGIQFLTAGVGAIVLGLILYK